ncbi:hypothetical protein ABZ467_30855 [Streptomyces sp. NPDC005727]|uniref:hypothetical protein n=1 Tax=Streptomyces sp. NPDC005727 TaxID=3157053 RepID=UPI0033F45075
MPAEVEVFSLSTVTEENAWLHGRAAARAWVTGSLRADDQLDISGEFDAQISGRVGSSIADGLAALDGELVGAAHAGLRLQVAAPMDAFTGAGLIARASVETSVSGQASVSATLSLAALATAVLDGLPSNVREYARILVDEATVSAGVWARGAFAVMAKGELISAVALFPTDGSDPGVTAALRYGYAWAFGGAWGTVVNVGLDPDIILPRLGHQLSADLSAAIKQYRATAQIADDSPVGWLVNAGARVLPETIRVLLRLGRLTSTSTDEDQITVLAADFAKVLGTELVGFILPRVLSLLGERLGAGPLTGLTPVAYRGFWDALLGLLAAHNRVGADSDGTLFTDDLVAAAQLVLTMASAFPADQQRDITRAVRCAVALLLLTQDGSATPRDGLATVLPRVDVTMTPRRIATAVLATELPGLLEAHHLLPSWLADLVGGVAEVADLVAGASDDAAADLALVVSFLKMIRTTLLESTEWNEVSAALPAEARTAVTAAVVLEEFCASDLGAAAAGRMREGFTACLVTLIGTPLSRVIEIVADTGLRAAPGALRSLADQADVGDLPLSLRWNWDQLARAVVGAGVGLPTAVLLRKVAGTVDTWCDTVLPEELRFLRRSLDMAGVCERILQHGTATALSEYKSTFLPELARHFVQHVADSIEFAVRDSVELTTALVAGSAEIIKRTLAVSAVAGFKLFEESIRVSEAIAGDLQRRVDELEGQLAKESGQFLRELRDVAAAARTAADDIETALVRSLITIVLGEAAASGLPRTVLEPIIMVGIQGATGGIVGNARQAIGTFADVLDVGAESLLAVAESPEGVSTGVRGVLERAWSDGQVPTVSIPIVIPIPNPLLPHILPDIQVEIFRVTLPAEVVGRAVLTVLLDAAGIGPLLADLDLTVNSLRATRLAIEQVKAQLDGQDVQEQRAALERAVTGDPLSIEVIAPVASAATAESGEIHFRVNGANASYAHPEEAGLPRGITPRVRALLNGIDVTRFVAWDAPADNVLDGRMRYTTGARAWLDPQTRRTPVDVFVTSPVTLVIVAADGTGEEDANVSLTFVPRGLPTPLVVSCVTRDAADPGRGLDEVGGIDATGQRWRLAMRDAVWLAEGGRRLYVHDENGGLVRLYVATSRGGRRYLRVARARGVGGLGSLPSCTS